jgi:hypothetical protein
VAHSDSKREKEHTIFSYSLTFRIFVDAAFVAFIILGNFYFGGVWTYTRVVYVLLFVGGGSYDIYGLWHKPLRRIRFFDSHFEISGWNVSIMNAILMNSNIWRGRRGYLATSEAVAPFGSLSKTTRTTSWFRTGKSESPKSNCIRGCFRRIPKRGGQAEA